MNFFTKVFLFCLLTIISSSAAFGQEDDLLSLLDSEEDEVEEIKYAIASFKTNRVVNLHSLENTAGGTMDFKISHRFGFLNSGLYDFFGLDRATIRLALEYGVTDDLAIGIGRSTIEKSLDGFVKYRFLRQSSGRRNMPVTASILAASSIRTERWPRPDLDYPFWGRFAYTYQLIVGRKFSEGFSAQLSPTVVHRNLVATRAEANSVYALGFAARQKITKRISINAEYIYVPSGQLAEGFRNSVSVGFDIETGGHVFQLHFTNSTSMIERGFITETTGDPTAGAIHFGFNISRVFTIVKPKEFRSY